MPAAPSPATFIPCARAASELGVTRDYLASLVARGRLPGVHPTPRCLLIPRADFEAFKLRRATHAAAAKAAEDYGITLAEVAAACNVELESVRRWVRMGLLPAKLLPAASGGRAYRVRPVDFQRFVAGS